ncbi:MAG: cysteine desulfurase NifS [Nitrospirae bacterium]|uniref:cysteine desulfurase NifS n=1 Tax=Candidatus Magnetobacterium casense TaxID=1455061 RepID=UPI00058D6AD3|nr:cysteine desulfurase NifS [Candidatus Magnetobacterium casensis]MBF0337877.1 cysteine desulfurase NifS [Nitrospirota bacterium]
MQEIYLDNNATTAIAREVFEEMVPYLKQLYGNPSSAYSLGAGVRAKIEEARARVATLIGADADEVVFTSCGTESNNTAILSALKANRGKKHIITTKVEHPAVLNLCKLKEREGYRLTCLPVDSYGILDMDAFMDALDDSVAVVSVMLANNETGVVFPIPEIGRCLRERGILFHTDAVQAVGKMPVDVRDLCVDMLSISGHKLHAPKGVGVLYVRRGIPFHPLLIGGHQEEGRRAGTENVASIIALGKACQLAGDSINTEATYVSRLRDKLQDAILEKCPDCRLNGTTDNRMPNTTNISFKYVDGEAVLMLLNQHGICASSGSACSSGSEDPSHVLSAMSVPAEVIRGSVRFSLSRYNTQAEIDKVIEVLPGIIKYLRDISPFGR